MCQIRVFHKWVRWKLWQINIKSLFLNIRVGIPVRGLHLVSFKIANFSTFSFKFSSIFAIFHCFYFSSPCLFSKKIFSFPWFFPSFHDFFPFSFLFIFSSRYDVPKGNRTTVTNCSMVHGPSTVPAHHMISYVTFESVYKTTISDLLRHFWIGIINS